MLASHTFGSHRKSKGLTGRRIVARAAASVSVAMGALSMALPASADIYEWQNTSTGTSPVPVGTGNDFTNPANWIDSSTTSNGVPGSGDNAYIDSSAASGAVVLIQAGDNLSTRDVLTGSMATTYGIVVMTGGSLTFNGGTYMRLAYNNVLSTDTSIFQMSGGTITGPGNIRVGESGYAALNFSGGSITSSGDMYIADAEQSASSLNTIGTVNMIGGNLTVNGWLTVGRQVNNETATAVLNFSGGTITVAPSGNGGQHFDFGGTTNTVNMTGGTLNALTGDSIVGEQRVQPTVSVWNMSGGAAYLAGLEMSLQNGSASLSPNFSATINLNAGTICTSHIYSGGSASAPGTSIFNFNGGTLQLSGSANNFTTFMGGLTASNVLGGGAIIDTNGSNGTITQVLASGVTGGTDGGLTKLGQGILTLAASNTYTGNTNVSAGALDLYYTSSVNGGATPSNVFVANGAGLVLGIGGTNQFTTSDFTNITTHATFAGPTASIGIDTGAGSLSYSGNITDSSVTGVTKLGFIKSGANSLTLGGSNTYSGPTLLAGNGTTFLGSSQALGTNSALTISTGALLDLNGYNLSIGSLASSGPMISTQTDGLNLTNGAVLTVGSDNTSTTYSYRIRGSGSLVKVGTGNLTLNYYDDQFTGGTTVNGGTLTLAGPGGYYGTISGTLTINSGGTVVATTADGIGYGGNGPAVGTLVINAGGTFVLGANGLNGNNGNEGYQTNVLLTGGSMTAALGGLFNFANGFGLTSNPSTMTANVSAGILIRGSNLTISTTAGSTPSGVDLAISGGIQGGGSLTATGTGTLSLSGSNTYGGGTIVTGGKLLIASGTAIPAGTNLTINAAAVAVTPHTAGTTPVVLQLNQLSLSGATGAWTGQLDLANNAMLDHTDSLAQVTSQVAQGYNGGAWNGSGISSSTASLDSSHLTAQGVIQNNQGGTVLFSNSNPFDGVTPNASDVLVKYTYYGDTDLNGEVDGSDYSRIDNAYLNNQSASNAPLTGWFNGDFNYDGGIDGSDYTLIDNAFNQQGAALSAQLATSTAQIAGSAATSAVPEPASMGLLAIGTLGLLGRRNRRCR